jgi:hypothetical protein
MRPLFSLLEKKCTHCCSFIYHSHHTNFISLLYSPSSQYPCSYTFPSPISVSCEEFRLNTFNSIISHFILLTIKPIVIIWIWFEYIYQGIMCWNFIAIVQY